MVKRFFFEFFFLTVAKVINSINNGETEVTKLASEKMLQSVYAKHLKIF